MEYSVDTIQDQLLQLFLNKKSGHKQISISNVIDKSGWENNVFLFTLHVEDETGPKSEKLLLKLYRGESGAKKAIGEFYGLQELDRASYPVPAALAMGLETNPFGNPYVVIEQVSGQSLLDALHTASLGKQKTLIELFCQLFVDLHHISWQPFVIDTRDYQPELLIQRTLAENHELINKYCPGRFDTILKWLYERSSEVSCERLSVIHWDFHPGNILLTDDLEAHVIDWTQAEVSDYRFDLAWSLLLLETFEGAQVRKSVLQEYEYYAGQPIPHLDFFEVAICLKRLFEMAIQRENRAGIFDMSIMQKQRILSIQAAQALLLARTGITLPDLTDLYHFL